MAGVTPAAAGGLESPSNDAAAAVLPAELDLAEAMRIMDVASALRHERDIVEQQFNHEQTKQLLRDKLRKTAEMTGESLTAEQLDAAINWYFENLHEFREPEPGWETTLAHAYVRRGQIAACLLGVMLFAFTGWWVFTSSLSPLSSAGRRAREQAAAARVQQQAAAATLRAQRELEEAATAVTQEAGLIRALAPDADVLEQVQRLVAQAEVAQKNGDRKQVQALLPEITQLRDRLDDEYTVEVVAGEKSRSAFERFYEDQQGKRLSGHYVVVRARDPHGKTLRRRIRNFETDRDEDVEVWAERVPKEVYERLKADKLKDGVLNETKFGVKRPGRMDEEVLMKGADGLALPHDAQITKW